MRCDCYVMKRVVSGPDAPKWKDDHCVGSRRNLQQAVVVGPQQTFRPNRHFARTPRHLQASRNKRWLCANEMHFPWLTHATRRCRVGRVASDRSGHATHRCAMSFLCRSCCCCENTAAEVRLRCCCMVWLHKCGSRGAAAEVRTE